MQISVFLLFSSIFAACSAIGLLSLPSYIKPCRKDDPEFSKCAVEHGNAAIAQIVAGDPLIGLASVDPFTVREIQSFPYPKLNVNTSEVVLYGLKDVKLISFTKSDMTANATVTAEQLRLTCKYSISGQIREHTIEGCGETEMKFYDVVIPLYVKLAKSTNEMFLSVIDAKAEVIPKKVIFKMISFEGDQDRVKLVVKSANENWKEMMAFLSPVLDKLVTLILRRTAETFHDSFPINMIYA